ncbi:MAG TPA: substrate-binding domain-containing protein, partial [Polyangiaceae bacterium]|nr:substrate-binding domain-containing protein [Polyangiaceae bacterium]
MRLTTTSCPNVGLFVDCLATGYQRDLIEGVSRAASQRGANLWVFIGGWFTDESLSHEDNVVYQLARRPAIDGLVVASSTLLNRLGAAASERILRGLGLPLVSLGLVSEGIPSLGVDNKSALVRLCEHLVGEHGYRKFAIIGGPEHNPESQERIAACRETLARLGVTVTDEQITCQGFLLRSGMDGVRELFDTRKLQREAVDAIICASDLIAEGAVRALSERGIRVPEHVAVSGFDDL